MASGRLLAEQYGMRPTKAIDTTSRCVGLASIGDGRIVWTLPDEGRVQCCDAWTWVVEWTADDCGDPRAVGLVPMDGYSQLWVVDTKGSRIVWLNASTGGHEGELPDPDDLDRRKFEFAELPLSRPHGIAVLQDPALDLEVDPVPTEIWVADTDNNRLVGFRSDTGEPFGSIGEDLLDQPRDVAALDFPRLATVCRRGGHVFSRSGELLCRFNFHLMVPTALTFDTRGAGGVMVVVDEYTERVLIFCATTGEHLRTLSDTGFCTGSDIEKGVAFAMGRDGYGCRLYVADDRNKQICEYIVSAQSKPPTPMPPPEPVMPRVAVQEPDGMQPTDSGGGSKRGRRAKRLGTGR